MLDRGIKYKVKSNSNAFAQLKTFCQKKVIFFSKYLLCLTVIVGFILGGRSYLYAQQVYWIDSRWLLLAHPIMQSYDENVRRFKGTSSYPIEGELEGLKALKEEIPKLEKQLQVLEQNFLKAQKNLKGEKLQQAEKEYLNEKKKIMQQIQITKERISAVQTVPSKVGLTSYETIKPQINEIAQTLRKIYSEIINTKKPIALLDVASILPMDKEFITSPSNDVLFQNKHFHWWRRHFDNNRNLDLEWFYQAKKYWAKHQAWVNDPVPVNGVDGRQLSLEILQKYLESR